MSFPGMLMHTVQIVKAGVTTSRAGDPIKDWDTATRTASKAWLKTNRPEEDERLRDDATLEVVFFVPATTVVANEDRIEMDGRTYLVTGPPKEKYSTRGLHHFEIKAEGQF